MLGARQIILCGCSGTVTCRPNSSVSSRAPTAWLLNSSRLTRKNCLSRINALSPAVRWDLFRVSCKRVERNLWRRLDSSRNGDEHSSPEYFFAGTLQFPPGQTRNYVSGRRDPSELGLEAPNSESCGREPQFPRSRAGNRRLDGSPWSRNSPRRRAFAPPEAKHPPRWGAFLRT